MKYEDKPYNHTTSNWPDSKITFLNVHTLGEKYEHTTPAIYKDNKQLRKIKTTLQQNVFFSTKMVHTDDQTPVTTVMRQGRRYQKIENNLF